jgi:predicted dithiol-disulfide oxidoreductase (DUF899 family)
MHVHDIARADEWMLARRALVEDLTRLRAQLYSDPCELPWLVEPALAFEAATGIPLAVLFGTSEESTRVWSSLFDQLEGYLRTLN